MFESKFKYFTNTILIVSLICCLFSCENDIAEVQKIFDTSYLQGESARDVIIYYSDSADVKTKVIAPRVANNTDPKNPGLEFPEGLRMEFFNRNQQVSSWLTAKSATRYEKEEYTVVKDSVVFENKTGELMKTEELYWDEKKGIVYTNRFIKFIKPNGDVIYGYGFSTNEDFTRYEIHNGDGLLSLDGLDNVFNK